MPGVKAHLHFSYAHCRSRPAPVLPLRKAAAPVRLIGQVFVQVLQQRRSRLRVPGDEKGGVQPVPHQGPVLHGQPFVPVKCLRVLPVPALGHAGAEVLLQPFRRFSRPGNIGVLPIEFQHTAHQADAHAIPPPVGAAQQLLCHKTGTSQGRLQLLPLEKRGGFLVFPLRLRRNAGAVSIVIPVELEEVLRLFSRDSGNPLQDQFTQGAIENLRPAHDRALQVQFPPGLPVYRLRQILPAEEVQKQPQSGGVTLVVHVRLGVTAVFDVKRNITPQNVLVFFHRLDVPRAAFRQPDQMPVVLEALPQRQLVAAGTFGQGPFGGNPKNGFHALKLRPRAKIRFAIPYAQFSAVRRQLLLDRELIGRTKPHQKLLIGRQALLHLRHLLQKQRSE